MVRLPPSVWQWSSRVPGPHICVIGGTHGNELVGIHVARQLVDAFINGAALLDKGTLTVAVGNPEAVAQQTRGSTPHGDLNRCFGSLSNSGSFEEERAQQLAPLLEACDVLVDLHATNKPSPPFLRVAGPFGTKHQRACNYFSSWASKLVLDPNFVLAGKPVTTDEFCGIHGGVGICLESGQAQDMKSAELVYSSLQRMLQHELHAKFDTRAAGGSCSSSSNHSDVFELVEALHLTTEGFSWAPGVGNDNFEFVPAGTLIGTRGRTNLVEAEFDAYLLFPKLAELFKEGLPFVWLCRKTTSTLDFGIVK